MNYFDMYQQYSKSQIQFAGFMPGLSQYRKREYLKMTGVLGLMGVSMYKMTDLWDAENPYMKQFSRVKKFYEYTQSEELALLSAKELKHLQSKIADIENEFRLWTGILLTTYALNVLDAFLMEPEGGYRKDQPFRINMNMVDGQAAVTIGYKTNF
jgi:hypothetical protein